jgi:Domain of unknown function (DUF4082)
VEAMPIAAYATYVASYHAPAGHYSADTDFFVGNVVSGPLVAPAFGGNGVYCYGAPGCFPAESCRRTNYWVDVVFAEPPGAGDGPADEEPPTAPGSLTATAASSTRIDLRCHTASDNVGVAGYEVRRDGTVIASLGGAMSSHSDTGLNPSTDHAYEVIAFDAAGNMSEPAAAAARILAAGPPPDDGADLPVPPTASGTEDATAYAIGPNQELLLTVQGEQRVFYPRCIYHVDTADLDDVAALGFNCTLVWFNASQTVVEPWQVSFINTALANGLAVFPEWSDHVRNQQWSNLESVAADLSSRFPIIVHHGVDEPQYWQGGMDPADVAQACDRIVAADPKGRPCWNNHERNFAATAYARTSDITSNDYYPVRYAGQVYDYDQIDSLARVYEYTDQTLAANPGAPVWFSVQAIVHPQFTNRYPTPAEVRAMSYLALQAGATGLSFYAWADNYSEALGFKWDNAGAAALRQAFPDLNADLAELMPVYTYGQRTVLDTGSEVIALTLDLDSKQWIVAVNPTARTLSARLPGGSKTLAPFEVYIDRPRG